MLIFLVNLNLHLEVASVFVAWMQKAKKLWSCIFFICNSCYNSQMLIWSGFRQNCALECNTRTPAPKDGCFGRCSITGGGVTERRPFGVISVSGCWIYVVATCYMGPFNTDWEEVVSGVWWKSSWLTIFSAPSFFRLPVALTDRGGQEHSAVIWTSGRSVSQGPRRCEIWDTFHSTLPSFWRKERRATSQAKRQLFMLEQRLFFEGAWLINSLPLTSFLNWLRGKES